MLRYWGFPVVCRVQVGWCRKYSSVFSEEEVVDHRMENVMQVISDVERYSEFVPGILRSSIVAKEPYNEISGEQRFTTELLVGVNSMFSVSFQSDVVVSPSSVKVSSKLRGPDSVLTLGPGRELRRR